MPKLNLHSSAEENSYSFNATFHFRVAENPWPSLGCSDSFLLPGEVCPGAPEPFSCGGGAAPGAGTDFSPLSH